MQNDIIAVASDGFSDASFWPTNGNRGALAKWNSMTQVAKITSGRHFKSVHAPEGSGVVVFGSAPRALQ